MEDGNDLQVVVAHTPPDSNSGRRVRFSETTEVIARDTVDHALDLYETSPYTPFARLEDEDPPLPGIYGEDLRSGDALGHILWEFAVVAFPIGKFVVECAFAILCITICLICWISVTSFPMIWRSTPGVARNVWLGVRKASRWHGLIHGT